MKKLIIAPYSMHKDIVLDLRNQDAFSSFKIIDKNELISSTLGEIKHDAIAELMVEFGLRFDTAKEAISYLPFIDLNKSYSDDKIKELQCFKRFLQEKSLISYNPFFHHLVKGNDVEIIGYSQHDIELDFTLKLLGLKYNWHNDEKVFPLTNLFRFQNIEEEVLFTLNECAKLIKSGVESNNIILYISDSQYADYINRFKDDFGLTINIKENNALYTQRISTIFLKNLNFDDRDFVLESIKDYDKDLVNALISLYDYINRFSLSPAFKRDYVICSLKNYSLKSDKYKNAIECINEPAYIRNKKVFVLGFKQNEFPKGYKDINLLNDEQCSLISMNTSENKTNMSRDILLDFFCSNNEFSYSYSIKDLSENSIYLSPLASKCKVVDASIPQIFYSKFYAYYSLGRFSDLKYKYLLNSSEFEGLSKIIDIEYGSYIRDYSVINEDFSSTPFEYSPTSTSLYFTCPFKYYLDKIIKFDPDEKCFAADIGTVFHKCLESYKKTDQEISDIFNEQIETLGITLPSEKQLLLNLKEQVLDACHVHKLWIESLDNCFEEHEKFVSLNLNPNVKIKGFIDCVINIDDYYAVIDYKTGSTSFKADEMDEGKSLQLPIYYLIASESFNKDKEIAGMYIQHIIDKEKTYKYNSNIYIKDYLELDGKTLCDSKVISLLDKDFSSNRYSIFLKNIKDTDKGLQGNVITKDEFDSYKEKAKEKILEADNKIRNKNFEIKPSKTSNKYACEYCMYKDICKFVPHDEEESEDGI